MADETRATDQTAAHTHRAEIAADADVEATIPPDRTGAAVPERTPAPRTPPTANTEDPETARAQIERTRMRMSETIDEIEDVLIRKKEQIQDRLDFLAPVRERPLASLGVALGAGVLLGLLTGGDDEDERDDRDLWSARARGFRHDADLEERAETWEQRARRLLRIAREQEDELRALTGGSERLSMAWSPDEARSESRGEDPSGLERLVDQVTDRVTGYLTGAIRGMFRAG
jgi:ElaB/YqjD/DUF883 family membrane-anchored ribosome-binding protein